MADVERCNDVRSFFCEHVTSDARPTGETAAETQGYLVDLLSGFSVSDRNTSAVGAAIALLHKALQANGSERFRPDARLGDIACHLRFFPTAFPGAESTVTYVVQMGGRAYLVLGEAVRGHSAREMFVELGGRFQDMARVLDEVRERTAGSNDTRSFGSTSVDELRLTDSRAPTPASRPASATPRSRRCSTRYRDIGKGALPFRPSGKAAGAHHPRGSLRSRRAVNAAPDRPPRASRR